MSYKMEYHQICIGILQILFSLNFDFGVVVATTSVNNPTTTSNVITTILSTQSTGSTATKHQDFYIATVGSTPATSESVVPDVVLALCVIAGCGLLGLGIAKAADYLYDRRMATKDDISNASTYTKNLLRARVGGAKKTLKTRLAVMKMKKDPANPEQRKLKRVASAWIKAAASKNHTQVDVEAAQDGSESQNNSPDKSNMEIATIVVDEATPSENDSVFGEPAQTSFIDETQKPLNQKQSGSPNTKPNEGGRSPPSGAKSLPRRTRSPIGNKATPTARLPPINHPKIDTLKRSQSLNQPITATR